MKKIMFLIIFISTSIFAQFDKVAYKDYKKTDRYQAAASKPTSPLITKMNASYIRGDSMLNWETTLPKIEDLTGEWADIGAIAKGNHQDFIYLKLTPVLIDSNQKAIYRARMIQRKISFGVENKVTYSSPIPKDINFKSVTLEVDLITDNSKNKIEEQKQKVQKKTEESKLDRERKRALRRQEIEKLNASLRARGLLKEEKTPTHKYRTNKTEKSSRVRKPQNNYSSIIMSNCKKKWNTNYNMIKYCVNNQTKSYNSILRLPNNEIMSRCRNKWGTNYNMIKYCVDNQTESKRSLGL